MGENLWGQLGDGTTTSRSTPVQVASEVDAIAAGWRHSLFITVEASVDPLIGGTSVDGLEDWYSSDWFGYYNTTYAPWIYHGEHGWLYRDPPSTNAESYFYDDVMASWWYTNETDYPYIFAFDTPADNLGTVA